jgi:outer membrane lipoprotein-sorting protein
MPQIVSLRLLAAGLAAGFAAIVVAAVLAMPASAAAAFDLAALMSLLATPREGTVAFTEQRFVKTLDAPLHASGTLSFAAPDRLERRQTEPGTETMQVDGNRVTLTRGGRSKTLMLDASPDMLGVIEALRGTLTGNGALLSKHFRTTVSGDAAQWSLELVPLQPELKRSLAGARLWGRHEQLLGVEMTLADGDRSVTTITPPASAPTATRPPG